MRISVIIPTYNRAAVLARAVESVISQSFEDWDLWVVDDGGNDDSERLVGELALMTPRKIHYIRIQHLGVSAARNRGVQESRSPYIAFLDSDDEWRADKLEQQIETIEAAADVPLVYSSELWIRSGRRVNPPAKYEGASGRIVNRSIKACVISPSTVLMYRSTFDELGGFDENFPVCEDYDLWLRLCCKFNVEFIENPLVTRYGGRPDQLSLTTPAMDYWRVLSMNRLAKSSCLRDDERLVLNGEIVRRGRVLIKGYAARGNTRMIGEVGDLIRQVVPGFRTGDV